MLIEIFPSSIVHKVIYLFGYCLKFVHFLEVQVFYLDFMFQDFNSEFMDQRDQGIVKICLCFLYELDSRGLLITSKKWYHLSSPHHGFCLAQYALRWIFPVFVFGHLLKNEKGICFGFGVNGFDFPLYHHVLHRTNAHRDLHYGGLVIPLILIIHLTFTLA